MILLSIVLFLALIGVLCYHKTSLVFSSILLLAYTAVMGSSIFELLDVTASCLGFISFCLHSRTSIAFLYSCDENVPKVMPPMSSTERSH